MKSKQKIILEQFDEKLPIYKEILNLPQPAKGWIRAIREALGMSSRQLAARVNTSQQRLSRIEKQELSGDIKISTINKVAKGLNCVFIYVLIPESTLQESISKQAKKIALKRLERVNASMVLEDQEVYGTQKDRSIELAIRDIVENMNKKFWDQ